MDSFAYLIKQAYEKDNIGQLKKKKETKTEIFVTVLSITRNEFYKAGSGGITPDYVLKTASINYTGEQEIELDGVRYAVYRTYSPPDSDDIELYVHKKAGVV